MLTFKTVTQSINEEMTTRPTTLHIYSECIHIHTLKTGTLPKKSENLSESIVAEVTINLRSFLLATTYKKQNMSKNTSKVHSNPSFSHTTHIQYIQKHRFLAAYTFCE